MSPRNSSSPWRRAPPLLFLLGIAGCYGSNLSSVKGKVVYPDGAPVPAGRVIFAPVEKDKMAGANGWIQPDGTFRLGTYKPGDGAFPGKYRVAIYPPADPEDEGEGKRPPRSQLFDVRYQHLDTSGLEFEVQPGANDFTITLSRPGKPK